MRAEVHEHGGLTFDIDDAAKAVPVMRHQITPSEIAAVVLDYDGNVTARLAGHAVHDQTRGWQWVSEPL